MDKLINSSTNFFHIDIPIDLLRNWRKILLCGVIGGAIGAAWLFIPKYQTVLTIGFTENPSMKHINFFMEVLKRPEHASKWTICDREEFSFLTGNQIKLQINQNFSGPNFVLISSSRSPTSAESCAQYAYENIKNYYAIYMRYQQERYENLISAEVKTIQKILTDNARIIDQLSLNKNQFSNLVYSPKISFDAEDIIHTKNYDLFEVNRAKLNNKLFKFRDIFKYISFGIFGGIFFGFIIAIVMANIRSNN